MRSLKVYPAPVGFRPIPRYEGRYSASRDGRVFSHCSGRCLKPLNTGKYFQVGLGFKNQQYVHILIALTFKGRCPDGFEIDHKNRNKQDNRVRNLRYVEHSNNSQNQSKAKLRKGRKASSKFKGVTRTPGGKWMVLIGHQYKVRYIGTYPTEATAARAYDAAAIRLFGKSATTNKRLGLLR